MMSRNDVFLDAMGLGPQWRLRNAPAEAPGDDAALAAAGADMAAYADDGMVDGSAVDAAPPAAYAEAPAGEKAAQGLALPAVAVHAVAPVPAGATAQAAGEQAGGMAPAAPVARATPPGGEDTSWFDDAPAAPSTRPALKSPPPAKAPPPARPVANGAASTAAQPDGESYAWFDDVPASPVAKPVRAPAPGREAEDEAPGRPAGRPAQPMQPMPPVQPQGMPDDGIPWFDDAPPFDGAFDDMYGEADAGITDAAIARMDWPALRAAVQSCTRCALCRERSAAVPGRGPDSAPWLVLATAPNGDDEAQLRPLAGAPGQLLGNMLKAIKVAPDAEAYVTTLVKCRPQGDRAPAAGEVAACRPYLERELALAGSRAIVTLGHTAAKGLLGAAARGKVLRLEQIPVVATYHPADLLRKPEDKAKAWADLLLARAAFDGRA